MRTTSKHTLLAALLMMAAMFTYNKLTAEAEVSVSTSLNTDYFWRHSPVEEGINNQTDISIAQNGTYVGIWGHFPLEGKALGDIGEVDLYLGHTFLRTVAGKEIGLSLQFTEYFFPRGDAENERELSLAVSGAVPLSPYVMVAADLTNKGATYAEIGVSHTVSTAHADVTLGADIGFQNSHYGQGHDEVQGFGLYATLSKAWKGFVWALTVRFDETDGDNDIWGGLTAQRAL